ncbi:2-oxoglutarate dehydrogenase E1 component [Bacteriovorax sp. PP10]|uniref:oxoglutarate dehydrogenase (succinyl-transferring) n=1 Tax=Bacteriovorax antarcticus TaxID=3088717 RepID=A0ABU5VUW3_9BACT|nr:2-oxoglutarate dehydrogenase E1 component [Bacteriovorax sp. PP10]MEA9356159.1 2-oxoglutarate dehydrogenase E1 component [Bacteriovorax sp. PP10]
MSKIFDFSALSSSDITFIDSLYDNFRSNPESVDESWQRFFQGFEFQSGSFGTAGTSGEGITDAKLRAEINVFRIIQSFRSRGHLLADTNPIRPRRDRKARISLEEYGLSDADRKTVFQCGEFLGIGPATLDQILDHMKEIYCAKIGFQYMHSNNTDIRRFMREKIESTAKKIEISIDKKKRILQKLNEANVFENFLQTKYVGQKRFSLEGGEATIPALDAIINKGAELGAKEFVIGMAHRGRLNVLANTVGKTYEYIFTEFEGGSQEELSGHTGDVKYHMGFTSVQKTMMDKEVFVKLLPNPSHLETVAPVAIGYCRALEDNHYNNDFSKVIPIIIHGDAAVAGQGVVYETLQMSKLKAYNVGGSIHMVINNQIGFTTDIEDARSSQYCVSVAKAIEVPIIQVNGDDPEAVVYAVELAVEFRQKFNEDIFIDIVCYRKYGHNEGDEPRYTQPHLYGLITKHKNPRELYLDQLMASGKIEAKLAADMMDAYKQLLSDRFNNVRQNEVPKKSKGPHKDWEGMEFSNANSFDESPATGVKREVLDRVAKAINTVPAGMELMKKAQKVLDDRQAFYDGDKLDWALGELLAYGSLLDEGHPLRFTGQDVVRGTFSHRQAKMFDERTNEAYCGLENISPKQGRVGLYNSLLSEYAVLGFEYGYAWGSPQALTIWEAQFGDFSNGAQIMIDQYITSAEVKWQRMNGLVMLLPHGNEGAGPEHSSARPERYLQMAADNNVVVANCTTPANMFHLLRRQIAWNFRKPAIVMTPKSLLRDPRCTSTREELSNGRFQEVLDDPNTGKKVTRLILCTGKIYYDMYEKKIADKRDDVAIVRLEQIHPLPEKQLAKILEKYKGAETVWVQEEAKNQGYWTYLLRFDMFRDFKLISRKSSASPATGFSNVHKKEQAEIVTKAFSKEG